MNARTFIRSFSLALLVLAFAGVGIGTISADARSTAPRQARQTTYAAWLNKQVHHELATLPWYGVFDNLEYRIDGSQVALLGQVVNPVTKSDAENRVKHIEGVTRVVDRIQVLPLSPFDDQIRRAEYRAIFSEPSLSRYSMGVIPAIHIIVDNGHVTLEGVVDNAMDRNLANMRARMVPDVFSVTNHLRIT
ncbi:MAG TPA: BON domain-containing protein [Candidatus Acidoferrales bacterium]|nr:BON domain-containing protein [Candidatus Acidoferrales bacterium]